MKKTKTRLLVKKGEEYVALQIKDIVLAYRDKTIVVVLDKNKNKYLSDKTLTQLQEELDPLLFFRANRKYLVNIQYIKSFRPLQKVKLEVNLFEPIAGHQVVVSQETAPHFKKWVAGEHG